MFATYKNDQERRKKEVIPGTFDPVFKSIFTTEREYLAEIINKLTKIPKIDIIERAQIRNSEYIIENIEESSKTSDLIIDIDNNVINIEMNRNYYPKLIGRNNRYLYKLASLEEVDKKIMQINFDLFNLYKDDRTIIKFEMIDKERGIIDKHNLIKYVVNLELIKKKYYNEEKLNDLEKNF